MGIFSSIASIFKSSTQNEDELLKHEEESALDSTLETIEEYEELINDEVVSLNVEYPCGFSFEKVQMTNLQSVNLNTGELLRDQTWIHLTDEQYGKVVKDLRTITDAVNDVACYKLPELGELNVLYSVLVGLNGFKRITDDSCEMFAGGTVEIRPLTPTGRIPKFPVNVRLEISHKYDPYVFIDGEITWDSKDATIVEIYYFKDGSIGRCDIHLSHASTARTKDPLRIKNYYLPYKMQLVAKNGGLSLTSLKSQPHGTNKYVPVYEAFE